MADAPGVLLIHGFTGTPFEMRYLGQRLSERGLRARGLALAGHLTTPAELAQTSWQDWVAGVERGFDEFAAEVGSVAIVGQSLGGLLALYLAAQRGLAVAAVVSLAAPLWLFAPGRALLWATRPDRPVRAWLGRAIGAVPKITGADVRDWALRWRNPSYPVMPIAAIHELAAFMDQVAQVLPRVVAPTLVIHARRDHTAPYACSERIAAAVGSARVAHSALGASYHLIAGDVERDRVAAEVFGFLTDRAGETSAAGRV
ncbi:MAG: alpha/beta hydrolase [Maricaulaceae bacterium]